MTFRSVHPDELDVRRSLVVFTRLPEGSDAPQSGGAPDAQSVRHLIDEAQRIAHCQGLVCYAPAHASSAAHRRFGDATATEPQHDGDFGTRLAHAIERRLSSGADHVVVVGADQPGVDALVIEHAFSALRYSEVVYGPTADGNIYLVGMKRLYHELLEGIPWMAGGALSCSLQVARRRRLAVTLLPEISQPTGGWVTGGPQTRVDDR
jgi:glycosyltransferase A (GT-A) superfamily protein (DUF2064 family)